MAAASAAACSSTGSVASPVASASAAAPSPTATPVASATPAATATLTPQPIDDLVAAGATRIHQDGEPDWLALAGGSAWTAVSGGIQQLDGTTGAARALVEVANVCTAMDAALDSLWVADCQANRIARIDPATAQVVKWYPVGSQIAEEGSVGVGSAAIWVATASSALVRVDIASGATTTYELPGQGAGVRVGLGSVWVTMPDASSTLRIDPSTGSIVATIPTGSGPRFLAVGEGAVWVQGNGDGTVTRIDRNGKVVATIQASSTGIEGGDMAAGGGFAWARISTALVAKIDPSTNAVVAVYGPPMGSGSVAADKAAAWISAHDVESVWRLPLD
jgi:virginiamycin B lyase